MTTRKGKASQAGQSTTKIKITDIVTKIVANLTPLSSEDRQRAIRASLTLLGEESKDAERTDGEGKDQSNIISGLPPRAGVWMKQNGVSMGELEQVFNIVDGTVEVIASEIPGKDDKTKTYSSYILTGIASLLATGNPSFDDKSARAVCKASGCLNIGNHASYLKEKGNEFTGSKGKGWSLTAPGLKRGAALVKELAKPDD